MNNSDSGPDDTPALPDPEAAAWGFIPEVLNSGGTRGLDFNEA